jgi:hypothetical protein
LSASVACGKVRFVCVFCLLLLCAIRPAGVCVLHAQAYVRFVRRRMCASCARCGSFCYPLRSCTPNADSSLL